MLIFRRGPNPYPSVSYIDTGGGQNPYISTTSQCYHNSFCPRGGPHSIDNRWAMAGFAPPPYMDPPLLRGSDEQNRFLSVWLSDSVCLCLRHISTETQIQTETNRDQSRHIACICLRLS